MVGLERGTVELVSDRESWTRDFEAEATRLRAIVDNRLCEIEHVGSTAVEGLAAKPIVDMVGVVDSLDLANALIPALEAEGYTHRPNDEVDDRVFLAKGAETDRTHYLSLTTRDSDTHRELTAFRDHLRENSDVAATYESVKRDLAARYPDDRAAYTREKSAFVESVTERALLSEEPTD